MKKSILVLLLFGSLVSTMIAQESFTYVLGTHNFDWCNSSFYIGIHDFVVGSSDSSAYICRFSNANDLIEKVIYKPDTACVFYYGVEKDNGEILAIGRITALEKDYLYCCFLSTNLEIVEEKYVDIVPEGYNRLDIYDLLHNENGEITLAAHLDDPEPGEIKYLLLLKLNQAGELIDQAHHISFRYSGSYDADLIRKSDQTGYYYFNSGSLSWLDINNELAIVDSGNWYPDAMGTVVSAKYLTDGNLAFVSMRSNLTYFYDIKLAVYTPGFEKVKDTVIIESGRQCPAIKKGIDYVDPENVWVVAHNDNGGYYGIENYRIYLLDSQMNIKGSKFIVGDTDYTFYYLMATQDGGCLITGSVRQEEGANTQDIFILKVMPEDILTGVSENIRNLVKDVMVYPNPFNEKIYTKTDSDGLIFSLHNLHGKLVLQSPIPAHRQGMLNTADVEPGVYVYSIADSQGTTVQSGKLIK